MELHVQKKYFDAIVNGQKIYEWRLAKDKYRMLKIWDEILFRTDDAGHEILKKISTIHIYDSFMTAWNHLWIEHIVPGVGSIDEMVGLYHEFYSLEDEKKYNIIMIGVS